MSGGRKRGAGLTAAKAAKDAKKIAEGGKVGPGAKTGGKRRKRRVQTFSSYVYKVLKQVQPDESISRRSMGIMNSLLNDSFQKISTEAYRLMQFSKCKTISGRTIQTAVRLCFPPELAKHGVSEGVKAVKKYSDVKFGAMS
jgi:histone H2B